MEKHLILLIVWFTSIQIGLGQYNDLFNQYDESPRFLHDSCELVTNIKQKEECANLAYYDYVQKSKLVYPELAKKHGIEGSVVIGFTINKEGNVTNAVILKDLPAGCGQAALDFVNQLPTFRPAMKDGEAVQTDSVTLLIKFDL